MAAASDYLETALLAHIFLGTVFEKPETLAVALLLNPAADSDTGNFQQGQGIEVSSGNTGYARAVLPPADGNWSDPQDGGGITHNLVQINFAAAVQDWGFVRGVAIVDTQSNNQGNMLVHGAMQPPRDILEGDVFSFAVGAIRVAFQ